MREEVDFALVARLDDLIMRSERGEIARTAFLTPGELLGAGEYISRRGLNGSVISYGGYRDAERACIYFLPEYLANAESYYEVEEYLDNKRITALRICGSGYRALTHRDYLGSLLSLGIERAALGDIVFEDENSESAILFCDALMAEYIKAELKKIANDAVKVSEARISQDFEPYRSFLHISDTVASERIDCVVASLCSLSRERAKECVGSEAVSVNYRIITRPDMQISAPCTLSVRGYGKFRINSISERTKKGRLRISADKYL